MLFSLYSLAIIHLMWRQKPHEHRRLFSMQRWYLSHYNTHFPIGSFWGSLVVSFLFTGCCCVSLSLLLLVACSMQQLRRMKCAHRCIWDDISDYANRILSKCNRAAMNSSPCAHLAIKNARLLNVEYLKYTHTHRAEHCKWRPFRHTQRLTQNAFQPFVLPLDDDICFQLGIFP